MANYILGGRYTGTGNIRIATPNPGSYKIRVMLPTNGNLDAYQLTVTITVNDVSLPIYTQLATQALHEVVYTSTTNDILNINLTSAGSISLDQFKTIFSIMEI